MCYFNMKINHFWLYFSNIFKCLYPLKKHVEALLWHKHLITSMIRLTPQHVFEVFIFDLNFDLFSKGCIDSAQCSCSLSIETVEHYFLVCPQYQVARGSLLAGLRHLVQTMLHPHVYYMEVPPSIMRPI